MARPASAVGAGSPSDSAVQRGARAVEQRLRVRQALVLGVQLVPFVVARRELVELADLPGQALALALQRRRLRARASASAASAAFQACQAAASARGVDAGLRVEQRAHRGRPRQALPGVLAVDVDQLLGRPRAAGATVAGLPLIQARLLPWASIAAAQQQRVAAGVEAGLVEPGRPAPAACRTRR